MSITLLTGSPGHGKSYSAVREIESAVSKGIPVATNVPLRHDWAETMARRHTLFGRWRPVAVSAKAETFTRYVVISNDFDVLLRVRLSGTKEGRGRLIIDEVHRHMNARGWDNALNSDGTIMKRPEALAKRMKIINHLSGHRHYGFDCILITQSEKAIDLQARELYEFHSEVRNMKKLPWIGFFLRFNLFLRVTRWNDKSRSKAGISTYWLNKSLAKLYDTHALQHTDWAADAIVLPFPERPVSNGKKGSARQVLSWIGSVEAAM
jgi:zona occludens toxin (predicted ATPase)